MNIEFPKHISIFVILQRSHSFNKQPSCLPCCHCGFTRSKVLGKDKTKVKLKELKEVSQSPVDLACFESMWQARQVSHGVFLCAELIILWEIYTKQLGQ